MDHKIQIMTGGSDLIDIEVIPSPDGFHLSVDDILPVIDELYRDDLVAAIPAGSILTMIRGKEDKRVFVSHQGLLKALVDLPEDDNLTDLLDILWDTPLDGQDLDINYDS